MKLRKYFCTIMVFLFSLLLWSEELLFDISASIPDHYRTMGNAQYEVRGDTLLLTIPVDPKNRWPGLILKPQQKQHFQLEDSAVIAMDVRNCGSKFARLEIEVVNLAPGGEANSLFSHRAVGGIALAPGEQDVLRVRFARIGSPAAKQWTPVGMLAAFDGFNRSEHHSFDHHLDTSKVDQLRLFVMDGTEKYQFKIQNIRREAPVRKLPEAVSTGKGFYPCIDRYGQYRHGQWPGKITEDADLFAALSAEEIDLQKNPEIKDRTSYGGWASGPTFKATGSFYPVKYCGKWFLVDPEGKLFWSLGLNSIDMQSWTGVTAREHYFEALPDEKTGVYRWNTPVQRYYKSAGFQKIYTVNFQVANCIRKYGVSNYETVFPILCRQMKRRLESWGINTIGNWSDSRMIPILKKPYVFSIGYSAPVIAGDNGWWQNFYETFSPEFEESLRKELQRLSWMVNDPRCIGFFVGNEISWGDAINLVRGILRSPAGQPSKIAFADRLKERYGSVGALNQKWGSAYSSWEDFLASRKEPDLKRAWKDLTAFNDELVRRFFATVRNVFRKYALGKLFLGCRLLPGNRPEITRIAAEYVDVLSFNLYRYSVADFKLPDGVDKPILIGEWHFGTMGYGPPHPSLCPAASQVDRARAFDRYVKSALQNPSVVGAHYFACYDQPASGRWIDSENMQYGFLSIADSPYPEMVRAARNAGAILYQYRIEPVNNQGD